MKHFAEMLAACIVVGYLQHRYNVSQLIVSFTNKEQNAEITDIQEKVNRILKQMAVSK